MRCPSCGGVTDSSDGLMHGCSECGSKPTNSLDVKADTARKSRTKISSSTQQSEKRLSTLIEFPGVTRSSVPEWRKELSERVREVQERRARDAAQEAREVERQQLETVASPPQLELLPQVTMPTMNPLVAAALKRIERAHQGGQQAEGRSLTATATALAYAPETEDADSQEDVMLSSAAALESDTEFKVTEAEDSTSQVEKSHNGLVAVPSQPFVIEQPEPLPTPRRLIRDDPNDPALNYLDAIARDIRVEEVAHNRASAVSRLTCGVLDLGISALLCSPILVAMKLTNNDFQDPRMIGFSVGAFAVMAFLYLTISIALTGRTWAMRLLSLRVIDTKTGLFPTGGQSAGRAFVYLISLATAGLGILYALLNREGYTAHDRMTHTAVIAT